MLEDAHDNGVPSKHTTGAQVHQRQVILIDDLDDLVDCTVLVGNILEDTLDNCDPFKHTNPKLSKALFLLRRAKNILNLDYLKSLYFSSFHLHLVYGILVYSSAVPSVLNSLISKQKMAISFTNSKYNAHTAPLFKKEKILPCDLLV